MKSGIAIKIEAADYHYLMKKARCNMQTSLVTRSGGRAETTGYANDLLNFVSELAHARIDRLSKPAPDKVRPSWRS